MMDFERQVRQWLDEDQGHGDVTTIACVDPFLRAGASLVAKESGVLFGVEPAMLCFAVLEAELDVDLHLVSGDRVEAGEIIATLDGVASSLLTGERVALNIVQHLSGIATLTARYVAAVAHTNAIILDTRKTTPGLRLLEKNAVLAGGGRNHRFGLSDGILIKDNHIIAAGGIEAAVGLALLNAPHTLRIEVEVETPGQAKEAIAAGAEALLLDNMPLAELRKTVMIAKSEGIWTEASGGITLETVAAVAETGVDAISVGALTHSAPALDISLDLILE